VSAGEAGGSEEAALVAGLRESFDSGRTRPLAWRLGQLAALEDLLLSEAGAIEAALAADLGRDPMEGWLAEVYGPLREVRALRRALRRLARTREVPVPLVLQPARSYLRHEPLGVVAVIAPFNFPLNLSLVPLAAALAAGNCAVVKPSELAPASAAALAELLPRYLDAEAVAVRRGGPEASRALIAAGVDHVVFTGGVAAGREVAALAGERLIPVTLELGGKNPAVVAADADLKVAARRIAWGKLMNAGQSCVAPDYVLVEEGVEAKLLAALRHEFVALHGEDPAAAPGYARIVNAAHVERLARMLSGHGGEVVHGGAVDLRR